MSPGTKEKSRSVLAHETGFSGGLVESVFLGLGSEDYSITDLNFCQSSCVSPAPAMCFVGTQKEIERKFTPKKVASLELAASYGRLGFHAKEGRVSDCGTYLEFAHEISVDGVIAEKAKLHSANFCKDRLCPMCSWRRSYKIFGQVSQIMQVLGGKYKFLFLTLTVPNCAPADLSVTIDRLLKSWQRLLKCKAVKSVVLGYFRALEITRNSKTGFFHPHIHAVLAAPLDYGGGRSYIDHDTWLNLWRRACRDDSITQVDIRLARGKSSAGASASDGLASAVAEIAKYSVKSSDYLVPDDEDLTDFVVSTLSGALHHRRLASYGGVFADAWRSLNLDDPEDGDLVCLDNKLNPELAWLVVRYGWSCGVYQLADIYVKSPEKGVNV